MAVGDSTSGFQHTENNTGSQIQSSSQSITGTIGEARQVQMPEEAHTASVAEAWDLAVDWGSEKFDGLVTSVSEGGKWLWDHTGGAIADYAHEKYEEYMPKVGGADGIFVGMATESVDTFKTALNTYITGAQDILDGINFEPAMQETLKGTNIENAFYEFLDSVKTLLSAYIQSMHALEKEIDEAADNYRAADTRIGSDVSSDAGEIRSQAGSIDVA